MTTHAKKPRMQRKSNEKIHKSKMVPLEPWDKMPTERCKPFLFDVSGSSERQKWIRRHYHFEDKSFDHDQLCAAAAGARFRTKKGKVPAKRATTHAGAVARKEERDPARKDNP